MSIHVSDFLVEIAAKKERVSPVDVVMGYPWGEIELCSSSRLSLLGLMLKRQQQYGAQLGRGGSPALRNIPLQISRRGPQAMVKVIRNGGTTNARGMRDQMSYLEKDGEARLERSESFFGNELDEEAQKDLISAWGLDRPSNTSSDKTTHFVVSFPHDTDHDAAYRAGRLWAEELFASGTYGDVFDYYTAFHTDRAHPHMHVIVNRRGLENGEWLKISRRSQINYDELRAVQVEVSGLEGIYLEASPRLARGITDRPIPDAELRLAEKENREAKPPEHTPVTAIKAAATVIMFAEQIEASAGLISEKHPKLAKNLTAMARTIREGRKIVADPSARPNITDIEFKQQSEFIMSRRRELLDGFKKIDAELEKVPVGPERADLERKASSLKAGTSNLLPDVQELQDHLAANADGFYKGMSADDLIEQDVKAQADQEVGELADSVGIDAATFISRYEEREAASKGLADQWRKDELEDIQVNLTYQDRSDQDATDQLAQAAYDDLHRNALQTYRQAERDLEAHRARKKEIARIAKLIREGRKLEPGFDEGFRKTVKETMHTNELRLLEAGHSEVFQHVTKDVDSQRALSRRYLEAELEDVDGARKLQLNTALAKIDRDADLASQQAAKQSRSNSRKDRSLDL